MQRLQAPTGVRIALATIILVLVSSCTDQQRSNRQHPTSTVTAGPATTSRHADPSSPTRLTCNEELTAGKELSEGTGLVLGLHSGGWNGTDDWQRSGLAVTANGERYRFFKTYTYVTDAAAPRTTIRINGSEHARIVYIDAQTWTSEEMTDKTLVRAATRAVSLSSCDADSSTGYAGGLLVRQPACVTLDIIAHRQERTQHQQVAVPLGQPC